MGVMDRAILLMFLWVPALVAGPADVENFGNERLEVVTPPNNNLYQTFRQSLSAYAVRTTMFSFPANREIVYYEFDTVSGTGWTTIIAGGRGVNFMTVRAESGARAFNFILRIQTLEVVTTTTTTTTTTPTTTVSQPTSTDSDPESDNQQDGPESSSTTTDDTPTTTCYCTCD